MSVAVDVTSESHTGTSGSASQASYSWSHAGSGSAKGVLVFVFSAGTSGGVNPCTGVTYGGVSLTPVSTGVAIDNLTEPGSCDAYYLDQPPTGTQTVVVTRLNNTTTSYAVATTFTAGGPTEVAGVQTASQDQAPSEKSVDDGSITAANSVRMAGAYYGGASPAGAGANSTSVQSIDLGNFGCSVVKETAAGTGARSVGFTGSSDDYAAVYLAVREQASWSGPAVRSVATFASGVAVTSQATSAPSGKATGDALILAVYVDGITSGIVTPTGWTRLDINTTSDPFCGAVYWRVATGGSDDTPTLTWGGSSHFCDGFIAAISGADTNSPVNAGGTLKVNNTGVNSISWDSVTTTVANCLLLGIAIADSSDVQNPAAGWREESDTSFCPKLNSAKLAAAGASGAVTGTWSASAANRSLTTIIGIQVPQGRSGTGSPTLGAVTSSAAGTISVSASGSPTLAALASSAAGAVQNNGAGSPTLGAVTSSGAGTVATPSANGTGSPTLATVTSSGTGTVLVQGAASDTLAAVASSSAGTVLVQGSASNTLAALSESGAGTALVRGSGSPTLATLSGSGAGTDPEAGSGNPTLATVTSSSAGTVLVQGALSQSLGTVASSGAGGVLNTGSGSPTLGTLSVSGAATDPVQGSGSPTLASLTSSGAGTETISGSGSPALGTVTLNGVGAVGDVPVSGDGSPTLGTLTSSSAGTIFVQGASSASLASLTCSSTGAVGESASGSPALASIQVAATGAVLIQGSSTSTLASLVLSAAGEGPGSVLGDGYSILGTLTSVGDAEVLVSGSGSPVLGVITLYAFMPSPPRLTKASTGSWDLYKLKLKYRRSRLTR